MSKISTIFIAIIIFFGCTSKNFQPKNFVKHFDKSNSKIFIDCKKNSDCKLQQINTQCPYFKAININNKKNSIIEYINKEKNLTKNVVFDCRILPNEKTLKSVCKNNICIIEIKK